MQNVAGSQTSLGLHRWGQGVPLVLLHGFLGDHQDWPQQLGQYFDCIALDLPGHGLSRHVRLNANSSGFEQVCTLIINTLAQHQISHFHLLGYSLGGRIALHLAQQLSPQLLSLTLESTHSGLSLEAERHTRRHSDQQWQQRMLNEPAEQWLERWYQQPVFADLDPPSRQVLIQARRHNDPVALSTLYLATGLGQQADLCAVEFPCPVTLITGEQDKKFSALAKHWLQQHDGQHWQHWVIKNAGHNVHRAQTQAFIATLAPILASA